MKDYIIYTEGSQYPQKYIACTIDDKYIHCLDSYIIDNGALGIQLIIMLFALVIAGLILGKIIYE